MMVRLQWFPQNGQVTLPSRVKVRSRTASKPMKDETDSSVASPRAPSSCSLASSAAPIAPIRPG